LTFLFEDGDPISNYKGKNDEGRSIRIPSFDDDDTLKKLMVMKIEDD